MSTNQAIGFLETASIARGIIAMDAMPKASDIELLDGRVIARGKFIVLFAGVLADVQSAMHAASQLAGDEVLDHFIIPTVHEQIIPAIKSRIKVKMGEALGVIETKEVASTIFAADASVKEADVRLIEARPQPGGKGLLILTGSTGDVERAVTAGVNSITNPELLISHVIIPQVHADLIPHLK
jgi:microcompartment protein CcmL/EutN